VYNPLASVTSTVAQVTVVPDTNPPFVANAYSYPHFNLATQVATSDQLIIEYNEPIDSASATTAANYQLSVGGKPSSVVLTNDRTVVLALSGPLTDDTAFTVTVTGVRDLVVSTVTSVPGPELNAS